MNKKRFRIPRKKIAAFCQRWKVREFSIFGSAIRKDFRSSSDVDVLVTFWPRAKISVFDLSAIHYELVLLFGRKVDLVMNGAIKKRLKPYILGEVVYA